MVLSILTQLMYCRCWPHTSVLTPLLLVVPVLVSQPTLVPTSRITLITQLTYDTGLNPVLRAKLQLNGHDRFSERDGRYFNLVQPYQHHERVPVTGVNVYSFGLKPEEHQPSGTCNMSRIDNATLHLTLSTQISGSSHQGKSLRHQLQCPQNHEWYGWSRLLQLISYYFTLFLFQKNL